MTSYRSSQKSPRRVVRPRHGNRRIGGRKQTAVSTPRLNMRVCARVAGWTLVVAVSVMAAIGVYHAGRTAVGSKRLRVQRIVLSGNERVSDRELAAYTGIELGASLLELDLDTIALRLRHHPWVEQVRVRRRLPDQVVVEVREHQPAAIVSLGEVYLADADGRLFKRFDASDRVALPVITGLTREDAAQRSADSAACIRAGIALTQLVATQAPTLRVDEAHFDVDLGWSVVASAASDETTTIRLHLGDNPAARLPIALAAMTQALDAGALPIAVFADSKKSPERVHVRLRAAPSPQRTVVATAN